MFGSLRAAFEVHFRTLPDFAMQKSQPNVGEVCFFLHANFCRRAEVEFRLPVPVLCFLTPETSRIRSHRNVFKPAPKNENLLWFFKIIQNLCVNIYTFFHDYMLKEISVFLAVF